MDSEDEICHKSKQNMVDLLEKLRKHEGKNGKLPTWIVELAHAKIFDVSQTISAPSFVENLFHEEKRLERHLASMHGFLLMLKSIEDSR